MEDVIKFMAEVLMFILEKLKEVPLLLRSFVIQVMASFDLFFPPEKRAEMIDQSLLALRSYAGVAFAALNTSGVVALAAIKTSGVMAFGVIQTSGVVALAWFDEVFPPGTRVDKINQLLLVLGSYAGVALAAFKNCVDVALAAVKSSVEVALAWFDEVFPSGTRVDKFNQLLLALGCYAGVALAAVKNSVEVALAWFDEAFPPETRVERVNQWLLALRSYVGVASSAVKNSGEEALAWFGEIYRQGMVAEKLERWIQMAKRYVIAAMVVTVALCICRCCPGGMLVLITLLITLLFLTDNWGVQPYLQLA